VADHPWGPWSEPFTIFEPWRDGGYCHFMHTNWEHQNCDNVHDEGREYAWGGEYGPYQFDQMATGGNGETTIYYTMSTWNPYTVVLMKSTLRDLNAGLEKTDNIPETISIYPNPCTDFVNVSIKDNADNDVELLIWSTTGELVLRENASMNAGHTQINTSALQAGMYYLQVRSPSNRLSSTTKLMVMEELRK
jgi:hypothetical protein